MTNPEFSDSFTTLLNSYSIQANFGEQDSKAEIVLDEYEKSVLLTQAQDIVVKAYFDRKYNQQGEGFDDSTRRQVDFSTLIKVATLTPSNIGNHYDDRGILFKMPRRNSNDIYSNGDTDVLFILNEKLIVEKTSTNGNPKKWILNLDNSKVYYSEPNVSHIDKSKYWIIEQDEKETRYYEQPIVTPHTGSSTYWTINDEETIYWVKPTYTYHDAVPEYWTINNDNTKYFTKPIKNKLSRSITYWTVNSDDTHYNVEPQIVIDENSSIPSYYTINDDTTQYDLATITDYTPGTDPYWTIEGDTYNIDPTDYLEFVPESAYWIVNNDNSIHHETEPTPESHTIPKHWTVYIDGSLHNIYVDEPTIEYHMGQLSGNITTAPGYYIISHHHGEEGPFDTMPIKNEEKSLTYYTVELHDEIYLEYPTITKIVTQEAHWTCLGNDYYTIDEPTVVLHPANLPVWTVEVEVGGATSTLTFNVEPVITPHGTIYYYATVNGEAVTEPSTTPPTINKRTETEYYWVVDVTGNLEYPTEPIFNYYEGANAYYSITSSPPNTNLYEERPTINEFPGTDNTWTVNVNNTIYYEQPTIVPMEDPTMNYWVINDEPEHYSVEPTFTIVEKSEPFRSKYEYVIVPMSYKEYDREMSKPYAQPLKRQAWRLFQNNSTGFDFDSELIPRFDVVQQVANASQPGYSEGDVVLTYRIRYIRRPRPIILEDLPNGLEIDGESHATSCELNPILHHDILVKAVELALATRGKAQPQANNEQIR